MINLKKLDSKWYYVISEMFNKGSSYGILLILSYFLTDTQYGYVTLFNSILTLSVVFVSLNLTRNYITRIYFDKENNIKDVVQTIVSFLAVFNIVAVVVIIVVSQFDMIFSVPSELISFGVLVAMFMSNYDIVQGLLVAAEKKQMYCGLSIIYSTASVILALSVYLLFPQTGIYSFIGSKLFIAIISCIGALIYFIKVYHIRLHIDGMILKQALYYSLPLTLHSISGFLLNYFDRFMINGMVGIQDAALYSFAHNLAMLLNIVVVAINQGFVPKFYRLLGENNIKEIDRIISHNTSLLIAITVLYSVFIDNAMFLFPSYYRNLQGLTFMLIFSYILFYGYVIYSNYLYFHKKTTIVFLNTLFAGIVNVILNYFLIQKFNYIGATIATLVAYLIMYILFYLSARRMFLGKIYSIRKMTFSLLLCSVCVVVYYFARSFWLTKLIYIGVIIAAMLCIYRKRHKEVKMHG